MGSARLRQSYQPTQIWHYGYLQRFYAKKWHQSKLEKLVFPGAKVLDYGCGNSPYRKVILNRLGDYFGIDIKETEYGSLFDGIKAPFKEESFDIVVLAEVLPLAPNGKYLIRECQRLLKQDGMLIVSTSFIYPMTGADGVFQDGFKFDYVRYTEAGLSHLLEDDFREISTEHLGGIGSHLLMYPYYYRNYLMKNKSVWKRVFSFALTPAFLILTTVLNISGRMINRLDSSRIFPTDAVAVAKK